jgi:hypothetical protein
MQAQSGRLRSLMPGRLTGCVRFGAVAPFIGTLNGGFCTLRNGLRVPNLDRSARLCPLRFFSRSVGSTG